MCIVEEIITSVVCTHQNKSDEKLIIILFLQTKFQDEVCKLESTQFVVKRTN